MYDKEIEYYNFTINAFNYLNGRVNTFNRNCMLVIDLWTNYTLKDDSVSGDYLCPNIITIYIRAIIIKVNNQYSNQSEVDSTIRCEIIDTIVHELLHADQKYNILGYVIDEEYKDTVEKDVIISTSEYIWNNQKILTEYFGFEVLPMAFPHQRYEKEINTYARLNNLYDYYVKFISDVLTLSGFAIKEIEKELYNLDCFVESKFIEYDNIIILINGNSMIIKYKGIYSEDINTFSAFVYNNLRVYHRYIDFGVFESNFREWPELSIADDICMCIKIDSAIDTKVPTYPDGN